MIYFVNNFTFKGNSGLLRKSILCAIFYILSIYAPIRNSPCYSILSDLQTNNATNEIYKNKTIIVSYIY
jgi:hypothetical protein